MWKLKNAPSQNTSSSNGSKSFTMPNISDYFFEVQELAILEKKIPMQ
jgi:hypothetical protein